MPPNQALGVDFAALAIADEDFAKIYSANDGKIDFQKPEHVQQLTKSILKRDFGLKIELPSARLCPPVPVRYQYIQWLQSLLDTTSDAYSDVYDQERQVIGIDIGVGASCIYPLLGCACRGNWRFDGTEIDEFSIESAQRNVSLNGLQTRIRLRKVDLDGPILDLDILGIKRADFVMCNPPFFTSKEDMLATHESKKRSPSAVCTGADVEMITEGGDLGFVTRTVEESIRLRSRVQWYSSMLGKLASAQAVVKKLKDVGISNWAVTNLQAGNVTRRWAVAWSYDDMRPSNDVARGDTSNKDILPFPTEFNIPLNGKSLHDCTILMQKTMTSLDLRWIWNESQQSGLAFAHGNVWSRFARRKRQRVEACTEGDPCPAEAKYGRDVGEGVALGVRISLLPTCEVQTRWLKGADVVLYESFCGMLKRVLLPK